MKDRTEYFKEYAKTHRTELNEYMREYRRKKNEELKQARARVKELETILAMQNDSE